VQQKASRPRRAAVAGARRNLSLDALPVPS